MCLHALQLMSGQAGVGGSLRCRVLLVGFGGVRNLGGLCTPLLYTRTRASAQPAAVGLAQQRSATLSRNKLI